MGQNSHLMTVEVVRVRRTRFQKSLAKTTAVHELAKLGLLGHDSGHCQAIEAPD